MAVTNANAKVISVDDVLKIEVELPERKWERLMDIMRQRWTTEFLRGKPGEWISRLKKFGASDYSAGLEAEMTNLWKLRHTIVHASPVARPDQTTGLSGKARYVQSQKTFFDAISVIDSFVETTDSFVMGEIAGESRASDLPIDGNQDPAPRPSLTARV